MIQRTKFKTVYPISGVVINFCGYFKVFLYKHPIFFGSPNFVLFYYCSQENPGQRLDPSLVEDLLEMIDDSSILVQSFRMVRDLLQLSQSIPVKLRLFRNRNFDPRTYNVPDISEVAALIVGDFDASEDGRDIVVRKRDGRLQRIHETHPKYIPLQYPLLFPYGEDQYDEKIKRNILTVTRTKKKGSCCVAGVHCL
jgi:hypothetical protein